MKQTSKIVSLGLGHLLQMSNPLWLALARLAAPMTTPFAPLLGVVARI